MPCPHANNLCYPGSEWQKDKPTKDKEQKDDDEDDDDDDDDDDDRNVWEVNSEVGGGQVIGWEETPLLLCISNSLFCISLHTVFLFFSLYISISVFLFTISDLYYTIHCQ